MDARPTTRASTSPLRRAALLVAVALLVGIVVVLTLAFRRDPRDIRSNLVGKSAPSFDLEALDGRGRVRLADLQGDGKAVVVYFYASWCIPCKEEAPELAAAARAYRGRVVFLGIDIQDFTRDARKFMDDVDAPYVSVRDGTSKTHSAYGITGVPETYYLDRNGRVAFHSIGAVSTDDLEVGIRAALKDAS